MSKPVSEQLTARAICIVARAIEDSVQREAYVNDQCKQDMRLRNKIISLLAAVGKGVGESPLDRIVDAFGAEETAAYFPDKQVTGALPQLREIGPYKLLEEIGDGGMGVVYLAEQREPVRRKVALKVIKPGMDSREVIARFDAERQALAMMDHPNISRMLEAGTTSAGRPYFVMDLVKGAPITEFCDRQKLNTRQRLQLFITVCQAVQHAHQKGLIHRDLKPNNVLVEMHDVTPVPKVIDFGMAKALGQQLTEKTLHTGFGQMVGTPLYMSPEQAGGSSFDVDTRSDIYSLGVLLYELLTGQTPFARETLRSVGLDEMRRMIREVDPPRPSARVSTLRAEALSTISDCRRIEPRQLSQQLSGELDWIVMKALEKDRTARYGTPDSLAADLQCYLDDRPVRACPPSLAYRLRKFVYRKRSLLTMLAVFAVCVPLAAFGVYSLIQQTVAPDTTQPTTSPEVAAKPNFNARVPGRILPGLVPEPALIPDVGRWQLITKQPRGIIRSAVWNHSETLLALTEANHVRIYDPTNLLLLQVFVGHTQPTTSVAWHPDGERLASASEDGTVRLWTKTGVPTHLLEGHTGPVYQVAWRPDGEQLASASADGTVRLWNPEGKLIETLDEAGRHVFGIDWSSDGKLLATVGGDIRPAGPDGDAGDNSIRIWNADTGKLVRRIPSSVGYSALCVDWRPDSQQLAVGYGHIYRQMHWPGKPLPNAGIRIWNDDGTPGPEVDRDKGSVNTLAWDPIGERLAFGGRDRSISVWNARDLQSTQIDVQQKFEFFSLCWARNPSRLLIGQRDSVDEWDGQRTMDSLAKGIGRQRGYYSCAWSLDGTLVTAGQLGGGFKSWSPDGLPLASPERLNNDAPAWWETATPAKRPDGTPVPPLEGAPTADTYVKFTWSKDGWLAAASWHDQSVRIWNDQGKLVAMCKGHRGGVESVSWSPDGMQVASGGGDSVRVWNRDGTAGPVMTGHTDEVYGVAWSPDGQWIASGGTDSTVRLWKPDGTAGPVLRGHQGGVFAVGWSPDSRKLASASWLDNTLRVWDVASGKTDWQALRLDDKSTVTVSPLGFPVQGDPDVLDASLLYGLEQRDGTLELLTPSEFQKLYGTKLLPSLANRFNKLNEGHELTRSESELALALTLRTDIDTKGRIQIAETAEQLASALYFEREYGRAEQAIRTAIDVQEQVVAESPDDPAQKNTLSLRWLELGKVLSAAGRNTEALVEISRAIESRRQTFDADPEGSKEPLYRRLFSRALRQPTMDAAMADLDQVFELDPEPHKIAWDLIYFLDDLVEEPCGVAAEHARDIPPEQQIEIGKGVFLEAIRRLPNVQNQQMLADWLSSAPEQFRDPELALKLAQRALELDPGTSDMERQESVAWAQYRLGDSHACLSTLCKITGDTSASDFVRAMAYQSLGNTSEARAAFDRGCQWSHTYFQKVYVDRWSRKVIWNPTPGMIRRLQAEAAEMLGVAESELRAVSDPTVATNNQ